MFDALTIWSIVLFWLKCMYALWVLIGTALYLDRRKSVLKRHMTSLPTLLIKFALAPFTLVYVAGWIHVEPVIVLWQNYTIGCFSGRPKPYLPGFEPSCSEAYLRNQMVRPVSPHLSQPPVRPDDKWPERYGDAVPI